MKGYITTQSQWIEKYFPVVEASKLSLDDEFLRYKPETEKQEAFKRLLEKAIKSGLKDFRAQRIDPSVEEDGTIYYSEGKKPAIGMKSIWWFRAAKEFLPEKNSRLGLKDERIAFLGVLIKNLTERGYSISRAWKAVCDDSTFLGNYRGKDSSKNGLESTGSAPVGIWYDLGNTYKIAIDDGFFSLFGGFYAKDGEAFPLAEFSLCQNPEAHYYISVGWIVMDV